MDIMTWVTIEKNNTKYICASGSPISFTVTIVVTISGSDVVLLASLSDTLPALPSLSTYSIVSAPPGTFALSGSAPNQSVTSIFPLPVIVSQVFSYTVMASTTMADAGATLQNTVTLTYVANGAPSTIPKSATATVALCFKNHQWSD